MSMKYSSMLYDAQLHSLSTLAINSTRKEAWVGGKDGSIRGYDLNTNALKFRSREHSGLVVHILYWPSQRMMISFGIDGAVIFWSTGALPNDKIYLGEPLFHATIYGNKRLVIATKSGCKLFQLDNHKMNGHYISTDRVQTISAHKDFIRSLAAQENRLYSGGMDGTFVIYEHVLHHGEELHPAHIIRRAHATGITCIEPCRNFHEEGWLVATGSYDQHVKIWSNDGQLVHVITGPEAAVTGLSYVRLTHQLWIASNAPLVMIVDPRTGEDVSEWTSTWQRMSQDYKKAKWTFTIPFLAFSKDLEVLVAQTDSHFLLHWFYDPRGCIISIPCDKAMQSITCTEKEPILCFTGDSEGHVIKWERTGFNTIKFSPDQLVMQRKLRDAPVEWQASDEPKEVSERNVVSKQQVTPSTFLAHKPYQGRRTDEHELTTNVHEKSPTQTSLWIERIDVLVVADERGIMYVWGYENIDTQPEEFKKYFTDSLREQNNSSSGRKSPHGSAPSKKGHKKVNVKSSEKTRSAKSSEAALQNVTEDLAALKVDSDAETVRSEDIRATNKKIQEAMGDWKSYKHYLNRASGFFCRFILWGHDACVSGLDYAYDKEQDLHVLISTSWDRRIITWNLKNGQILDVCKRERSEPKVVEARETPGEYELVAEGQITDIAYGAAPNHVAYASRDAHLYIRCFSTHGRKMKLVKKWHAHNGEILQVKWMERHNTWVTSGQDGTVRIWNGMTEQLGSRIAISHRDHPVQCLTVDKDFGWVLAGVGNEIQIFDPETLELMRTHVGHQQLITGICHVHRLSDDADYVSASYDGTIKIWRACVK